MIREGKIDKLDKIIIYGPWQICSTLSTGILWVAPTVISIKISQEIIIEVSRSG